MAESKHFMELLSYLNVRQITPSQNTVIVLLIK